MEVLVVGNTAYVDDDFCAKAFPGDHVQVVAADDAQRESSSHSSWKELLRHLDQAYEFDRVVYLSTYLTPRSETFGDIELLRSVFRTCMGRRVQLLFVAGPAGAEGAGGTASNADSLDATGAAAQTGKGIIARAANDLCRYYASQDDIQVKILCAPYLYTASAALSDPFLVPLFEACLTGSVALQGAADAPFPLLCAEELAVLVHRVFDSWDATFETLDVADAFHRTTGDLGGALQSLFPGLSVAYGESTGYALPQAMPLANAMAGFSVTTCCATFRPSMPAGLTPAPKRLIPFVRPSIASSCARCPLNAWRRASHGCCSSCWSICSPNRPSSTCSTIDCSM